MRADHRLACEQIAANTALLRPGTSFAELHDRAFVPPRRLPGAALLLLFHGVGLCDEWPYITYPEDRVPGAFEGVLEPGMVLCVESLVSRERGRLLDQARGAGAGDRDGTEVLSRYPPEAALS